MIIKFHNPFGGDVRIRGSFTNGEDIPISEKFILLKGFHTFNYIVNGRITYLNDKLQFIDTNGSICNYIIVTSSLECIVIDNNKIKIYDGFLIYDCCDLTRNLWLEQSIKCNDIDSIMYKDIYTSNTFKECIQKLIMCENNGIIHSYNNAILRKCKSDKTQNYSNYLKYYEKAAENGHYSSLSMLINFPYPILLYYNISYYIKNYINYHLKLIETGNRHSMYKLGNFILNYNRNYNHVDYNENDAHKYMLASAKLGYYKAIYYMMSYSLKNNWTCNESQMWGKLLNKQMAKYIGVENLIGDEHMHKNFCCLKNSIKSIKSIFNNTIYFDNFVKCLVAISIPLLLW